MQWRWRGPRLAHVEDFEPTRRALARCLGTFGEIAEAATVREARELIDAGELIDLVVLDLMLPDGSGVEVLRHLKKRRRLVPVIVLSGVGPRERDELLRSFVVMVQAKPILPPNLLAAIAELSPQRFAAAVEHCIGHLGMPKRRAEMFRKMSHGAHGSTLARQMGIVLKTIQTMRAEFRLQHEVGPDEMLAIVREAYPWTRSVAAAATPSRETPS
jgi:CheY-like chemotaxis protein